jgi:hypothetical protein
MNRFLVATLISIMPLGAPSDLRAQAPAPPAASEIRTADLDREIREFLARELTAHVADIKSLDPPQDLVVGALTTGEFSWGTFMRVLAAYSELAHTRTIAGRDIPELIGQMGLIEARHGGKTFAQLYAALALRHFGTDLNQNAVWQSLSPEGREAWRSLLDPGRFYDRRTHRVINLPENYFGVASRIAVISFQVGITTDRAYVNEILDRAAQPFTSGALFADDAAPDGRFDRYSQEYARYVYAAAEAMNRQDLLKALEPTLKEQMSLWWDLLTPDGYGYPWGRSLGAIGYMDTTEIVAFLAEHPQFRPAAMTQLATAYSLGWRWLRRDFLDDRHLLSVFAFGRGNYAYINKEREWQQTTAFFGKLIGAHLAFIPALEHENIAAFPAALHLANVARFEFFRRGDRPAGVWIVRKGSLHFALPITTGTKGGMSDYLPAPHGLPGFAAPVELAYPALTPYLELEGGKIIVASDGADEIRPDVDGLGLTVVWKRWATAGGKAAATDDPGITTTVTWRLDGDTFRRRETLVASKPVNVVRWWVGIPTTADAAFRVEVKGTRAERLESREGTLLVHIAQCDWPVESQIQATGDSPLGRGTRAPIPLILLLTSRGFALDPGKPQQWDLEITTTAPHLRPGPSWGAVSLSPGEARH